MRKTKASMRVPSAPPAPPRRAFRLLPLLALSLALSLPLEAAWPEGWVHGKGGAHGPPLRLTPPRSNTLGPVEPLPREALERLGEILRLPIETIGWRGGRRVNDLERHDLVPRHHGRLGLDHPLRVVISDEGMLVAILGEPSRVFSPPRSEEPPAWAGSTEAAEERVLPHLLPGQRVLSVRQGWTRQGDWLRPTIEATCTGERLAAEEVILVEVDGELLSRRSLVCNLDGQCSIHGVSPANLDPQRVGTPYLSQPLPNLTVEVDGLGSLLTDAEGRLDVDLGGQPRGLTVPSLSGPYATVLDGRGPELGFSGTLQPSTPLAIDLNLAITEDDTAEVSAFLHINRAHDWLKGMPLSPPFTDLDFPLEILVSRPAFGACNAAFNPNVPRIFFLPSSQNGCPNTAYSTVIVHEYAHAAAFSIFGSNAPLDLHEGIADIAATLYAGDREVGRGFFGVSGELRDVEPNLTYPLSGNAHTIGLVYAGSIWDLRSLLGLEIGLEAANQLVAELWWESLFFLPAALGEELVTVTLLADDDDGDLSNGTPHEAQIREAFALHGLRPEPVALEPLLNLTDFPSGTDVFFTWSPGASYSEIRVERDGAEMAVLAGGATTWGDLDVPPGRHTYIFRAIAGATEAPRTPIEIKQRLFQRGDTNGNGIVNLGDAVFLLDHLFGTPNRVADCPDIADVNDNGAVNIADVISLLSYLFSGGAPPPIPFLFPSVDPTADLLPCAGEL